MYKINLEPKYDYTIPRGTTGWSGEEIRKHVRGELLTEEQVEWIFRNTRGRFHTEANCIYFEFTEEALAFKLRWL